MAEVMKNVKLRSKFATNSFKVEGCAVRFCLSLGGILSHNHGTTKNTRDQEIAVVLI